MTHVPTDNSIRAPALSAALRELWQHRELLLILVQRDLKVRYKNSALGFGWSLLNPLLQVATITLVIKFLMGIRTPNYHAYVFCASLPWLFFSTALMDTSFSLLGCASLLRRVYFPRALVPLAALVANFVHFLLATGVFLAYLAAGSLFFWAIGGKLVWPIQPTVLLVPIPMLGLALLVTGLALLTSVWSVYFEDVRYLLDSGLKILYWLVPIVYFAEVIPVVRPGSGEWLYRLYMLNPLSGFITAFRKLILPPTPLPLPASMTGGRPVLAAPMGAEEWLFVGTGLLISLAVAALGYRYFYRRQWKLAER